MKDYSPNYDEYEYIKEMSYLQAEKEYLEKTLYLRNINIQNAQETETGFRNNTKDDIARPVSESIKKK